VSVSLLPVEPVSVKVHDSVGSSASLWVASLKYPHDGLAVEPYYDRGRHHPVSLDDPPPDIHIVYLPHSFLVRQYSGPVLELRRFVQHTAWHVQLPQGRRHATAESNLDTDAYVSSMASLHSLHPQYYHYARRKKLSFTMIYAG